MAQRKLFQQQDATARPGELVGGCAANAARADNDNIRLIVSSYSCRVPVCHVF
jgi:hypothetical protein